MTQIREWLKGKKTYISAAALALVAIAGWWFKALDGTQALSLLTTAGALAGLGAKSNRTAEVTLAALSDVRDAQARAAATHKPIDTRQLAVEVAKQIAPAAISAVVPIAAGGLVQGEESLTPNSVVHVHVGAQVDEAKVTEIVRKAIQEGRIK